MDAIYCLDRPLVFVFLDENLKCIITDTAKILNFIILFFCKQNIAQGGDISIFVIQLGNHNPSLYINFYQAINLNCVLFIIRVHKIANHITQILHCCVLILHWLILFPSWLFHKFWCTYSWNINLSAKPWYMIEDSFLSKWYISLRSIEHSKQLNFKYYLLTKCFFFRRWCIHEKRRTLVFHPWKETNRFRDS